ncbi:MAG: NAD(P)H-dependent oxidoreductase [Sporolactobacillus sp.]
MKFVAIVGTNADFSYNRILLKYIQDHFSDVARIQICEINNIPIFKESDQPSVPDSVKRLADEIENADGVIFGCPEYDHAVPSPLKAAIEWLSFKIHPFNKKPVMIVGASYGPQGSSRAQLNLRQILDSPGVNARVLPGNEFLLGNVQQAFDKRGQLKDKQTIKFLEDCFADFLDYAKAFQQTVNREGSSQMFNTVKTRWDAGYDVIVLGFGGAGATAARFAADAGAKVLVVDAAPEGHEGGNTRYSAQLIGTGDDYDELKAYYQKLTAPMDLDEDMIDTYVEGMVNMRQYVRNYLDVEPFSFKQNLKDNQSGSQIKNILIEYPEFPGVNTYDFTTVHNGFFDAALWKILRQKVIDRADKIDVWLSSPARHLIQDPQSKTILGVQIERNHVLRNIRAKNGVVLTVGGFENNKQKIQDYIGAPYLAPLGTLYNKGDGIKMAIEVGADLWHMHNYESLGLLHGMAFAVPEGKRARLIFVDWPHLYSGSIVTVGDDGSRYFKEDELNRHGHIYNHGLWQIPQAQEHPHLIFDQTKYEEFKSDKKSPYPEFMNQLIKAGSVEELAHLIHADPDHLQKTIKHFNLFAKNGEDYEYQREAKNLRSFDKGPYYAAPLIQTMLNTQGGPRRNARTQILDTNHEPIPHLYGAGELGGICANQYAGGNNLAECLIFGKIAGENAATSKDTMTADTDKDLNTTATANIESDIKETDTTHIALNENQYLGRSNAGIGGEVVVRVTVDDDKIKAIEVLKQSESGDVGAEVFQRLPQHMIDQNTYDVDVVSGASASSNALKDAVKDALNKVKITQ